MYTSSVRSPAVLLMVALFVQSKQHRDTGFGMAKRENERGGKRETKSEAAEALWTNGESNPGPFPSRKLNLCQVCWRG
ncbi:hypothetical protein HDV57DRAFT_271200 [Trichoderma longibrachiatum]